MGLFPFLGPIGILACYIFFMRPSKEYKGKKYGKGSVDFGRGNAEGFKISKIFRFVYSAVWVAIGIVSIIVLVKLLMPWANLEESEEERMVARVIVYCYSIVPLCLAVTQIWSVWVFKYMIREYACPQCHHVNEIYYAGDLGVHSQTMEMLEGATSSGEHKTHSVYVDGKEVGGIYAKHSGYDYYVTREYVWQEDKYSCRRCGYSYVVKNGRGSTKLSERWERNDK